MANKDMAQTRHFFDPARLPIVYHPGDTLDEKLQEMHMGVKEFATRVSKPEKTIIAVIKGKSAVTPDMAVAFEVVTKIPAKMWLHLQKEYDEYRARKRREETLAEGISWAEKFPVVEIASLGWFAGIAPGEEKNANIVDLLCGFFAVSSPKGWEDFYLAQKLRVSFCGLSSDNCDPYALSAWLRQGEIQSESQTIDTKYSPKQLRCQLETIASVRRNDSGNIPLLISLLRESGVRLIFTDALSSAPVKGCTRYVKGVPTIQLVKKYDNSDDFWKTLYHEIGHILLHGKKDIFMENVSYGDRDPQKEKEAEEFASCWMKK